MNFPLSQMISYAAMSTIEVFGPEDSATDTEAMQFELPDLHDVQCHLKELLSPLRAILTPAFFQQPLFALGTIF